jgi:enoyl-CoA hydratase
VRATLIDRDHAPRWEPARLADVSDLKIQAYFAPLDAAELQLAPRSEMQAMR